MKNKYVTALMMLFAMSGVQLNSYDSKTLTIKNSTTKTLKVFIKSKYKNTSNQTRHDEKTMILGPATTVCKRTIPAKTDKRTGVVTTPKIAGNSTVYGATSSDSFTYHVNNGHDGQIKVFTVYDNANPTVALQTTINPDYLNDCNHIFLFEKNGKIIFVNNDYSITTLNFGGDTAANCPV